MAFIWDSPPSIRYPLWVPNLPSIREFIPLLHPPAAQVAAAVVVAAAVHFHLLVPAAAVQPALPFMI
jgi:hypothetical protein